MSGAAALTALEERHLLRLRARVQREAEEDVPGARLPWGHCARDSEAGRRKIAKALARLEYALAERGL